MLTYKNLFEIPVYRVTEADYNSKMSAYIGKITTIVQFPAVEKYFRKNYGGDWRFNEVVGFLRFYQYGGNRIRCEYWETDSKRKVLTRKKQFIKVSDSYCNELFSKSVSNPELIQTMNSAIEHCEKRLKNKKRFLDKELFDNTVNFIDWKSLLS